MKPLVQFPVLLMLAFILPTLLVGCSALKPEPKEPTSLKPSESKTKKLVIAKIKEEVDEHYKFWGLDIKPISVNGKEADLNINIGISKISIEEWASYNEERKYWPVRVRVHGSINGSRIEKSYSASVNQSLSTNYNKVVECEFSQDDYGKWKVQLKY